MAAKPSPTPIPRSVQRYSEEIVDVDQYRPDDCPQCEARDPLIGHGFYCRTLVDVAFDGVIRVRRYLCNSWDLTMNDLIAVERLAEWQRLKALVLDRVSSLITRRVYNMVLDEFIVWFQQEPRPGFSKATVSAWRASLEARLGSPSIIIRMSAIRKLAAEAADNGLLAPELAAGIARVKSAKSVGVRAATGCRSSRRRRF